MFAEIGLMQRLSVFLGHPTYSISVVLFTLVLFSGIGSFLSERYRLDGMMKFCAWSMGLGLYIACLVILLPPVFGWFQQWGTPVRILVSILLVAPMGLLMGFGFPTGIRLMEAYTREPTPWLWGVNGATGVLASGLAVAVSLSFGIHTSLYIGAICYLLLMPFAGLIGMKGPDLYSSD
jgi:hypothetical protein